jgi:carbon storage regulator
MLVLTRKLGEKIVINDNIVVSVLSVHGNRVRLGIRAPQDVGIQRLELLDRDREAADRQRTAAHFVSTS